MKLLGCPVIEIDRKYLPPQTLLLMAEALHPVLLVRNQASVCAGRDPGIALVAPQAVKDKEVRPMKYVWTHKGLSEGSWGIPRTEGDVSFF